MGLTREEIQARLIAVFRAGTREQIHERLRAGFEARAMESVELEEMLGEWREELEAKGIEAEELEAELDEWLDDCDEGDREAVLEEVRAWEPGEDWDGLGADPASAGVLLAAVAAAAAGKLVGMAEEPASGGAAP